MRHEPRTDLSRTRSPRLFVWWADRHRLSVEHLTAGIFGTLVLSATMASAAGLSRGRVVLSGIVTVLVYWVAEEYGSALAHHAVIGRVTRADVLSGLRARFAMVEASFAPVLVVLAAGLFGASDSTAVNAGLVVAAGSLACIGALAAGRSGMSRVGILLAALLAAALGVAVVLLKVALH
jgi:hypothetical protein